jgi:hypothetical protein
MHLEVIVGTVWEELLAARAELGEPGDELLRRRGGRLVKVDGGHGCSFLLDPIRPAPLVKAAVSVAIVASSHRHRRAGGDRF